MIEGKVDFMFEKDAVMKHIILSPREKLVYDSETDKVHLYKTSGKSELAWKDGEVVLDNTPLEEALWMLERRYCVKFVIKNEKLKEEIRKCEEKCNDKLEKMKNTNTALEKELRAKIKKLEEQLSNKKKDGERYFVTHHHTPVFNGFLADLMMFGAFCKGRTW